MSCTFIEVKIYLKILVIFCVQIRIALHGIKVFEEWRKQEKKLISITARQKASLKLLISWSRCSQSKNLPYKNEKPCCELQLNLSLSETTPQMIST